MTYTTAVLDYSQTMALPVPVPVPIHVDRFDIDNWAELAAVPTVNLLVGTVFNLIITTPPSGPRVASVVELQAGPANPADLQQQAPNDYDPVTNDKHWAVVGGYFPR